MNKCVVGNYPAGVARAMEAMFAQGIVPDGVTVRTLLKGVLLFSTAAQARGDYSAQYLEASLRGTAVEMGQDTASLAFAMSVVRECQFNVHCLPELLNVIRLSGGPTAIDCISHADKVILVSGF
jgi:hypothetical protein